MSTCIVTGNHPVEHKLKFYAPGETVTGVDEKNPHDQALIESGQLTPKASEKQKAAKPAAGPTDAGESGKEDKD